MPEPHLPTPGPVDPSSGFSDAVRIAIAALEPGEVVTYGEIAAQAGRPGAARAVGRILRESEGLPWWRVVAANGRLVPGLESRHAELLRREGIEVRDGRVRPSRRTGRGSDGGPPPEEERGSSPGYGSTPEH